MSSEHGAAFPTYRPRRLRQSPALRRLVAETRLSVEQLVLPLFVRPGRKVRRAIHAMPGVLQLSPDELLREASQAQELGVPAVLLFGIPERMAESGLFARPWTRMVLLKRQLSPTPRSLPPLSTGRFARQRNRRRNSATGSVIKWTPRTPTKRCAKSAWTSRKARTSSWSNLRC